VKIDEVIAQYQKILDKYPEAVGISMLIAEVYEKTGKFGKARKIYKEILNKNPNVHVAANNLAFNYADYEPTKKNLEKAEKLIGPLLIKYKKRS
jgi:tetratricopeptide (TPR) repeat protein